MQRRATIVALLSLAFAACSSGNESERAQTVTIVPDLTGYSTIPLSSAGRHTSGGPSGTFSYLVVENAIDWYVFANRLSPGRAYRILLTAADGK